jgi:hypothetical protein
VRAASIVLLEVHVADTIMVPPTAQQYTQLWSRLLAPPWGLRLTYRHDNIGTHAAPFHRGRVPPEVVALGAPSGQCCVEYVLVRPEPRQHAIA